MRTYKEWRKENWRPFGTPPIDRQVIDKKQFKDFMRNKNIPCSLKCFVSFHTAELVWKYIDRNSSIKLPTETKDQSLRISGKGWVCFWQCNRCHKTGRGGFFGDAAYGIVPLLPNEITYLNTNSWSSIDLFVRGV